MSDFFDNKILLDSIEKEINIIDFDQMEKECNIKPFILFHLLEIEKINGCDNDCLKNCLIFLKEKFSKKNKIISTEIESVFTTCLANKYEFTLHP